MITVVLSAVVFRFLVPSGTLWTCSHLLRNNRASTAELLCFEGQMCTSSRRLAAPRRTENNAVVPKRSKGVWRDSDHFKDYSGLFPEFCVGLVPEFKRGGGGEVNTNFKIPLRWEHLRTVTGNARSEMSGRICGEAPCPHSSQHAGAMHLHKILREKERISY